jgi:hypothetical protein
MIAKGLQQVRSLRGGAGGHRAKGMREVPTLTGQVGWSPPRSRAQAATEFARLEHERSRLQDEMAMRAALQLELEGRLELVCRRLAMVREMLYEEPVRRAVPAAPVAAAPAAEEQEQEPETGYQTISIEY